ncbi:Calcium channel YVC1 [Paramyrothecium foliicola]|nr:Calcium channel YVC1 [Paramyrothecium foliicola]
MFSSLMRRPKPGSRRALLRQDSFSASPGPSTRRRDSIRRHATADFTEADDDDEDDESNDPRGRRFDDQAVQEEDADEDVDEDDLDHANPTARLPVLPLFSSSHLDSLAVYSITHAIRIIVCARTETSLSWDQLRSPQVSQFLVKPMQQQIRTQHFSRATLYALMANCLQFTKEGQRYAANAGTSNTRARVCELLALKMLKEYSTRELIDALAYDFYPLQGLPGIQSPTNKAKTAMIASRTSTLEVAIRASAKHFLAHPVVVQQLEAIWNGAIAFYSSADSLHREAPYTENLNGAATKVDVRTPLLGALPPKEGHMHVPPGRRTVMLYDPRQASVFKLSRLRVPRYRFFLSTLSLAVLIGLFLAVLAQRSVKITGLELVFWFWSAGFMLDELVGFNEQGFALYIMSFWNIFDLGILLLLIVYYCMRAYGVFLADPHHWNAMAYDVLAANAILLLPRIFSVLDHYQYFSQLLIAFRLMAVDLIAVAILVLIACSGFYVFFTLSNTADDGHQVAFKIFQILMGFTPAAWDVWPTYNWLAKALMGLFLIICHFLVVTILITVLTNSFMTIASNANEEHQFLFAINTISMVKSDALFSYIAPSNIFAWLLMPFRYCIPLREFVWLNRTIIKITHFPVLLCIYLYERFWLAPSMYEPTDLVENPHRGRGRSVSFADPASRVAIFNPNMRVREESVSGFQKDRALEEVFRRTPGSTTLRTQRRNERRKTQTAIRNWMDRNDDDGVELGKWSTVDSRPGPEWQRRMSVGWDRPSGLRQVSDARSVASDPADILSNHGASRSTPRAGQSGISPGALEYKDHTDADGDDELVTNDEDEDENGTNMDQSRVDDHGGGNEEEDYFTTPMTTRIGRLASSHGSSEMRTPAPPKPGPQRRGIHSRTMSSNTVLYNPDEHQLRLEQQQKRLSQSSSSFSSPPNMVLIRPPTASRANQGDSPTHGGSKSSPRRSLQVSQTKPRPILGPRGITDNGGYKSSALLQAQPRTKARGLRRMSSLDLSVVSGNTNLQFAAEDPGTAMVGSFQTQMAMAMMKDTRLRGTGGLESADQDRMGRLILARMKTLEEGFADVIKEMRDLKTSSTASPTARNSSADDLRGFSGMEGAGRNRARRVKGTMTPGRIAQKRPGSVRSMAPKSGLGGIPENYKGKGKQVAYSSDEEAEESFTKRGSSL